MQPPPKPHDEGLRIETLCRLNLLDTAPEPRFDRITRIAQRLFNVPIALVSLVDADRQWFKSRQGLDATETHRDISFCGHAILGDAVFVVPNAAEDPRFLDNPLVTGGPQIRFYAGAPLRTPDGQRVGTLCIIDRERRNFPDSDESAFRDLADCVEAELERSHLAASQIRSGEQRIRAIVDNVVDGIITIDELGLMQTINRAAERIFGYPKEELLGRNVNVLMPEPYHSAHDDYLHHYRHTRERKIIGMGREVQGKRKDGSIFPVDLAVSEMEVDGQRMFTGIVRDITVRKEMELALKQFGSIVQTSEDAIISKTLDGTIRTWNPAAETMFGYSADEMIGRPIRTLVPLDRIEEETSILERIAAGEKVPPFETVRQRKDGSTLEVSVTVSPILDAMGQVVGASNIARDISERKQMERMKTEFISTVSHELRTPLTSIRGALSLVLGKSAESLPERVRKLLEMAERNSDRLTRLINDLLDLEKIEAGRMSFDFQSVDLAKLVRRAVEENEGFARKYQVSLQLVEPLPRAVVKADEHRLLQVLANLLSNAVKYSPTHGQVELSIKATVETCLITVQDHGPGIPEAFQSRMFQRFAQADSSDARERGGTGLGLSITKAIVERHEGHISYQTAPGQGTTFQIEFPAYRESRESEQTEGPRILICEDNLDVARILEGMLQGEGFACDVAATLASARKLLDRHPYRLLLLDLSLPDGDGLVFLQEVRGIPAFEKLPVVVISGRAHEQRGTFEGNALAVIDWIQKPLDRERLLRAVRAASLQGNPPSILHVEDDADLVFLIKDLLTGLADYHSASSLGEARKALALRTFDLVLLDVGLPDGQGMDLLKDLGERTPVLIFSAQDPGPDLTHRVAAALKKSVTTHDQLLDAIRQALKPRRG